MTWLPDDSKDPDTWEVEAKDTTTWAVAFSEQFVSFTHDRYGILDSFIRQLATGTTLAVKQRIRMFIQVGQSLALGGGSNQIVDIGVLYPEYCKNLLDGPKSFGHYDFLSALTPEEIQAYAANKLATEVTDFADAVEVSGISRGETIGRGLMDIIHSTELKDTVRPAMVFRANGNPGGDITTINKDTGPYIVSLEEVRHAKNLAAIYGAELYVAGIIITHGEADRDNATYGTSLTQLIADYRADIPAITGQTETILVFLDQTATPPITAFPLTQTVVQEIQLAVTLSVSDCYLTTPKYHLPYLSEEVHLTALGYRRLGEHIGNCYNYINRFGFDWKPVHPLIFSRSGPIVTVTFDVKFPPLVLDTTELPLVPGYGFSYYDDVTPIAITDVTVIGSNQVQITLASTPLSANQRLWYVEGGLTYPHGNLRDSMVKLSVQDSSHELHNWAVMFNRAIVIPGEADVLAITSLRAMVNAVDYTIGGGGELILTDKSASAVNWTNAPGVTVNPVITPATLNGYPVVTFAGVGTGKGGLKRAVSDLPTTTGKATFVAVVRRTGLDSLRQYAIASGDRTTGFVQEYGNSNTAASTLINGTLIFQSVDPTQWDIWISSYNNDTLKAAQYSTGVLKTTSISTPVTTPDIFLGQNSTGFQGLIGDVAEALVFYDDLLDPTNIADFNTVYGYLATKYGL